MWNWIGEQWKQIRGHLKYDVLRLIGESIAGTAVLGLGYAFRQRLAQLPLDVYLLGGGCIVSFVLFCIASRRITVAAETQTQAPTPSQADLKEFKSQIVEKQVLKLRLGDFTDVAGKYSHDRLRLELIDVPSADQAVVGIGSVGLQYAGLQVKEIGLRTHRYAFPRVNVADGEYSVFYWHIDPGYFTLWRVYVDHINAHAKEVTVVVQFVTSSPSES